MTVPRRVALGTALLALAASCAGSARIDALTDTEVTPAVDAHPDGDHGPGLIVVAGSPLRAVDSTGEAVFPRWGDAGAQPTWSRDGTRLIASTGGLAGSSVEVLDAHDGTRIAEHEAERPYFFFTWSPGGERIAALGPGRFGTTLDLLDADGLLVAGDVAEAGSLFVAWGPGGSRLLVHADDRLLVLDFDDDGRPVTDRDLGTPGTGFSAAKWVPGTAAVLYVEGDVDGRLVRHDLRTDDTTDLGPVRGRAAIAVHPDGDRAVVAHSRGPATPNDNGGIVPAGLAGADGVDQPAVEEVDLITGARTAVVDDVAFWTEWSPDGDRLLLATFGATGPHAEWWLWDGARAEEVATWVPTERFFGRYMRFYDQYVEQPRLWAPDSSAFVFAGVVADDEGRPDAKVAVVEVAGGAPSVITSGAAAFWSPAVPSP